MVSNLWALGGIVIVAMSTFYLGWYSSRKAITTPDFLVARRTVTESQNAAAISGEYLSAASFLSVAGLVLKDGVDALQYWLKLFAIAAPAFVLFAVFLTGQPDGQRPLSAPEPPNFGQGTQVT